MGKLVKGILGSRVGVILVAIASSFWVLVLVVPIDIFREILDSVLLAMAVMVLILYGPSALDNLKKHSLDRTGLLLLGIIIAWAATASLRGLAMIGRSTSTLYALTDSYVLVFMLWNLIIAATMHIMAPSADGVGKIKPYWRWIIAGCIIGGALAGFVIGRNWATLIELCAAGCS